MLILKHGKEKIRANDMNNKGIVYIVHCIDTEGALYESLKETFKRIERFTGKKITPSYENLQKIQNKELDLDGKEEITAFTFSERNLNYKKNWGEIDEMLERITSEEYRMKFKDSFGGGYKYNWFIMDWSDFKINPRCRDQGFNNIYTHYKDFYDIHDLYKWNDEFQFLAHPMSFNHEAHKCATSYLNSPHIYESLCHRIIDCGDFPSCFRPGFHTERPDSNWLLEQFIPFDYSNQSIELTEKDKQQKDLTEGRFGDWRRAPSDWSFYHPSIDDWQVSGNCRRTIFRCLNVGTRLRLITQEEVDKAFERANNGEDTILAFCDHDYREMSYDIEEVYERIWNASKKYPDVKFKNSGANEAAIAVTKINPIVFDLNCDISNQNGIIRLSVDSTNETFGPQPFLAIKTKDGRYFMDNFDFQTPLRSWTYTFDEHSILIDDIECIGIASNSRTGTGCLKVIGNDGSEIKSKVW